MIVVTGATGNVGRPLVEALVAAGEEVAAVSRGVSGHPAPQGAGVQDRAADLTVPATLPAALSGGQALFVMLSGAAAGRVDLPGVLDTAGAAGIERVVLLSSQAVATRPDSPAHRALGSAEEAVAASGLAWTVLRPGAFASNALAWAESVRSHRTVAAPFGDVGLPVVDPADIAAVAATALSGRLGAGGHAGRTYELTGPGLVTPRQQAAAIGEALGEAVEFVELSRAAARARMVEFMPEPVVDVTLGIFGQPTPAERRVSPDVAAVLGRPPRPFAQWARREISAFR